MNVLQPKGGVLCISMGVLVVPFRHLKHGIGSP